MNGYPAISKGVGLLGALAVLQLGLCLKAEPSWGSGAICPRAYARFAFSRLVHLVPAKRVLRMISKAGFVLKGQTRDGVAIIDAKTFPRGGSGAVRLQIQRAKPDLEEGLQLEFTTAQDDAGVAHGTLVLVRDLRTGKVVYVGVPPGHETVDPEIPGLALRQLAK